jgi:hypothetical protein
MSSLSNRTFCRNFGILTAAALIVAAPAFAQDAPAGSSSDSQQQPSQAAPAQDGWQKFKGGWGQQSAPDANVPGSAAMQNQAPAAQAPQQGTAPVAPTQDSTMPPATLTLPSGSYITVRTNQTLSSDHNQQGDIFSATLMQPVVVGGFVVAQSGQSVFGRVAEAKKAGMVKGVSQLKLELTGLTLVDGQNVNLQSLLVDRRGPTSVGRDAAAVGGTTALGAALGAAAGWGTGAAIGAGAGAAAGLIGVLFTRGYPTILPPETLLTFQLSAPVSVDTTRTPSAFQLVQPSDFQQAQNQSAAPPPRGACGPYGCPPPAPAYAYYGPGYYPYPYAYSPYYYNPFFYGPTFGFFYGPRYFYHGGYYGYGRGYYGRGYVGHR